MSTPDAQNTLRRKPSIYWDVPPAGFEHLTPHQYKALKAANKIPATAMPAPLANPTITRQTRRLYVGNVPYGVHHKEIMAFFNRKMHSNGLAKSDGDAVVACQLNSPNNYAFLEFRTPNEATNALKLRGIVYKGKTLQIRRPQKYEPKTAKAIPATAVAARQISKVVPDSPNKLFVGGLPIYLPDQQVINLLSTIGPLKAFNCIKDTATGLNRGYAFFEYVDPQHSALAISTLNGLVISRKPIVVQKCSLGGKHANMNGPLVARQVDCHPKAPVGAVESKATAVLCLLNMVTEEELRDDNEYEDILDDIKQECRKFGAVRSLHIPRPIGGDNVKVPGCGRVFVEFETVADCQRAQLILNGRKFSERLVATTFYDLDKYKRREF